MNETKGFNMNRSTLTQTVTKALAACVASCESVGVACSIEWADEHVALIRTETRIRELRLKNGWSKPVSETELVSEISDFAGRIVSAVKAIETPANTNHVFRVVNGWDVGTKAADLSNVPSGRFVTPSLASARAIVSHNWECAFNEMGGHSDDSDILVMVNNPSMLRDPINGECTGSAAHDIGEQVTTDTLTVVMRLSSHLLMRSDLTGPELDRCDPSQFRAA